MEGTAGTAVGTDEEEGLLPAEPPSSANVDFATILHDDLEDVPRRRRHGATFLVPNTETPCNTEELHEAAAPQSQPQHTAVPVLPPSTSEDPFLDMLRRASAEPVAERAAEPEYRENTRRMTIFSQEEPAPRKSSTFNWSFSAPAVNFEGALPSKGFTGGQRRGGLLDAAQGGHRRMSPATPSADVEKRGSQESPSLGGSNSFAGSEVHDALRRASRKEVPTAFVVSELARRTEEQEVYNDVYLFIPFVAMFTVYFFVGRNIESNHMSSAAITKADTRSTSYYSAAETDRLHDIFRVGPIRGPRKNSPRTFVVEPFSNDTALFTDVPTQPPFSEVATATQWLRWMSEVWTPVTFDCDNPASRDSIAKRRRGQTMLLHGARLRVLRTSNDSCSYNTLKKGEEGCYSDFSEETVDKAPFCGVANPAFPQETLFTYNECTERTSTTRGEFKVYPCSGHSATIPFHSSCAEVRSLLKLLTPTTVHSSPEVSPSEAPETVLDISRASPSADRCDSFVAHASVRMVLLEYHAYSPTESSFFRVRALAEITKSGAWLPSYSVRGYRVWTPKDFALTVFEFFFIAFVLFFIRKLALDWALYYRKTHMIMRFMLDFWNLLEIANLLIFVVSIGFRWVWEIESASLYSSILSSGGNAGEAEGRFPSQLDRMEFLYSSQSNINSINVVITYIKVLKYVRLNDRLNVLSRTFGCCYGNILAVLLVFAFINIGYGVAGVCLFGPQVRGYRNFNSAMSTQMFFFLGKSNYEELFQVHRLLGTVYFWSFVMFVQWIMFNMIIVILGDGFGQVCDETPLEPLVDSVVRSLTNLRYMLTKAYITEVLWNAAFGVNKAAALLEAAESLEQHLDLEMRSLEDVRMDKQPMTVLRDLQWWLPQSVLSNIGEQYMAVMWEDIVYEYYHKLRHSNQFVEREQLREAVIDGVRSIAADLPEDFHSMELQAEEVEMKLDKIVKLLVLRQDRPKKKKV